VGGSGYGRLKFNYQDLRAHRVAWELANGRRADGVVRHTCDTPLCVRADHLVIGTHADNVSDRHGRGRNACGERITATAKLTDDKVIEIRRLHADGTTKRDLARQFGVTRRSVSDIVRRKTWKHAVGPHEPRKK
jgi:DNA-binding NarL/FixJ family response regulator